MINYVNQFDSFFSEARLRFRPFVGCRPMTGACKLDELDLGDVKRAFLCFGLVGGRP